MQIRFVEYLDMNYVLRVFEVFFYFRENELVSTIVGYVNNSIEHTCEMHSGLQLSDLIFNSNIYLM